MKHVHIVLLLAFGLVLGLMNHAQQEFDLNTAVSTTCSESAHELNRWAHECQALITKVQADGHHEVLSNQDGNFWVETK